MGPGPGAGFAARKAQVPECPQAWRLPRTQLHRPLIGPALDFFQLEMKVLDEGEPLAPRRAKRLDHFVRNDMAKGQNCDMVVERRA